MGNGKEITLEEWDQLVDLWEKIDYALQFGIADGNSRLHSIEWESEIISDEGLKLPRAAGGYEGDYYVEWEIIPKESFLDPEGTMEEIKRQREIARETSRKNRETWERNQYEELRKKYGD